MARLGLMDEEKVHRREGLGLGKEVQEKDERGRQRRRELELRVLEGEQKQQPPRAVLAHCGQERRRCLQLQLPPEHRRPGVSCRRLCRRELQSS